MTAVVAAIDFGTHGTGYAWTEVTENPDGSLTPRRPEPNYRERWPGTDSYYPKDLSAVLLDPDGDIAAWGHEARQEWARLSVNGASAGHGYASGFKMALKADTYRGLEAPGVGTARIDSVAKAYPLVVAYLRRMRQMALREIQASGYPENRVRWCLTVPAIWDDAEKQLMRLAAKEAGLPSDRDGLRLALEPEAAALYCRDHLARMLGAGRGERRQIIEPGTRFMVVDCGGGTVDITAFRVTSEDGTDRLVEIGRVSGGKLGSEYINVEFVQQVLEGRLFGSDVMAAIRRECPHALLELVERWESQKVTARARGRLRNLAVIERPIYLPVPGEIRDLLPAPVIERLAAQPGGSPHRIVVTQEEIKRLFDKVVTEIAEHVSRQLEDMKEQDGPSDKLERILLVGGMSGSEYLQESLRMILADKAELLVPANPAAAVLFGAVRYGCDPLAIPARRARYTYGFKAMLPFEPGLDPECKRFTDHWGVTQCRERFRVLVTRGDTIQAGQRVAEKRLSPVDPGQARLILEFYRSTENAPRHVFGKGCQRIGELTVELGAAMRRPIDERRVEAAIHFGDTDIFATAINAHTGQQVETILRFDTAG